MKTLVNFILKMEEIRKEKTQLEIWLYEKEITEYANWRAKNPSDRTAKDKVINNLMVEDVEWKEKRRRLEELKQVFSFYRDVFYIVQSLIGRDDVKIHEIEDFIEDTIERGEND